MFLIHYRCTCGAQWTDTVAAVMPAGCARCGRVTPPDSVIDLD